MFFARENELHNLTDLYEKPGFGMTVIYGRRRIGKSTLISEFIKNKPSIFYTATKVGAKRNLELFSQQVTSTLDPSLRDVTFPTIESILDFITARIGEEKLILVIDELPYWAEKEPSLLSILQKYIDTMWADKNLMIILCGSALSFMENKVLSEKSPLFGRRSSQIKLTAFNYRDSALFVPHYTPEEMAICYGITGGIAKYLSLLDDTISLDDNIKRLFFQSDGYLYDETRNLLTQEFSDVTLVNTIIEQIASGKTTVNEIALKLGENPSTILYSLGKLMEIDLVEQRKCITEEKNRKKSQYVLKDHMFTFWYEFIPKAISVIEIGQGHLYYDRVVKPSLHAYMGKVFEDMCRYYTLEQGIQGKFRNFITKVGTWWGSERLTGVAGEKITQSADIDVVALSDIDKTAVIGECKFKNTKIDKDVYDTLIRRSSIINPKYRITNYLFFSLSGYTDWFNTIHDPQITLFTLEDLYR